MANIDLIWSPTSPDNSWICVARPWNWEPACRRYRLRCETERSAAADSWIIRARVGGIFILLTIIYTKLLLGSLLLSRQATNFWPFFCRICSSCYGITKGGHYSRKRHFRGEVGNSPEGIEYKLAARIETIGWQKNECESSYVSIFISICCWRLPV